MYPVGSEYVQWDIINGKTPEKLFNSPEDDGSSVRTKWEIIYDDEEVYFKTEGGSNPDAERVDGVQPDGIRDFTWNQSHTAGDHTHTLEANGDNILSVTGTTTSTGNTHRHTIPATNGTVGEGGEHSHSASININPTRAITSVSENTANVGTVQPALGGRWVIVGEWSHYATICSSDAWNNPPCGGHAGSESIQYSTHRGSVNMGDYTYYYWSCEYRTHSDPPLPGSNPITGWSDWRNTHGESVQIGGWSYPSSDPDHEYQIRVGANTADVYIADRKWIPPTEATGEVLVGTSVITTTQFSGSINSLPINISGSHSHTINIPTTTSNNDSTHTHSITANRSNAISVTGNTTSGGTHIHTFQFNYRDLFLAVNNVNSINEKVKIATETTVKNRQMRIWRRTV
jgi:hypothetical protein